MSVVNRSKRKNAGKRMAVLGAKMAEEDEAFWSHETWADDDDSGNESFHESDEDSALQKDVFDSDFNDSESDNEDEEVAAGEAEEREIRKRERASKSMAYKFPGAKLGGQKRGRRGFPGVKRVIGEGSNAGIVLNLPPASHDSLAYIASIEASHNALPPMAPMQTQQFTVLQSAIPTAVASAETKTAPMDITSVQQPTIAPPPILPAPVVTAPTIKAKDKTKPAPIRKQTRSMKVSVRESRSTHGPRKLRGQTAKAQTSALPTRSSKTSGGNTSDSTSRAAKRKKFAQEELLLEAVHETEPENQRWLHGRKRVLDQHNQSKDPNLLRDQHRGKKVIQKFHSRRGCLITLTFPEMDAVPEILTRRHESTKQPQQKIPPLNGDEKKESAGALSLTTSQEQQRQSSTLCVITGKTGKYKDPLTELPYHDLAAFRELRRRHKEGIPIVIKRFVAGPGVKQNNNLKTAPGKARRSNPPSRTKTAKGGKSNNKRATNTAAGVNRNLLNTSANGNGNPITPGAAAAKTASKETNSPSSLRRLSPRKWKPSGKILETISMLPEKTDGNIPRGLGIQPLLPTVPSLNSNVASAEAPVGTVPSSSTVLAPKLLPPETSLSASTKDNIPPTQTKESSSNGASNVPPSGSQTSNIAGSSAPMTGMQSKEKVATDNNQAKTLIQTKVEESSHDDSAKTGATIDKRKSSNLTGQIKEKPEPKQ